MPAKDARATKTRKASGSPFGEFVRKRALDAYFAGAGAVTADNAWTHVYRLLLSIDRRTRLAHVMDSNHMQPGGSFHSRAVRFTEILCKRWGVTREELPDLVDTMFRACVEEHLAQKPRAVGKSVKQAVEQIVDAAGGSEEVEEGCRSSCSKWPSFS